MAAPPSEADRDLAGRLGVTPRQVERWREGGYIPGPIRRGLGRGLGTVAVYSTEAAEQAADFAAAAAQLRRLDDAVLVSFLHGFTPRERTLRRAYGGAFSRVRDFLGAARDSDPWEIGDRWSRILARRSSEAKAGRVWRANLKSKGKAGNLQPMLTDLIAFFLGGGASDQQVSQEVFDATGTDRFVAALPDDDRDRLNDLMAALNLSSLEETAASASLNELETARDQLQSMLEMFGSFEPDVEWTLALVGVPGVLIAGSLLGATFAVGLAQLQKGGTENQPE